MNAPLRDRLAARLSSLSRPHFHLAVRPSRRGLARLAPLTLILVLLVLFGALSGCSTTSPSGKIIYTSHFTAMTRPAVTAVTMDSFIATANCGPGEYVLAGGYRLTATALMEEWQAASPRPQEAKNDIYGLYRPIPPLMRVFASAPSQDMKGWAIAVTGMATPSEGTRTIYVYAYCASGIQQPQRVDATIWTTNVGDAFIVDARCPAGTLAVGGGFSAGSYTYNGGAKTAYLPVYRSILRDYGWQVASDGFSRSQPSFGATFDPYPSARLDATAICASTRDFTRIAWQGGPELPFSTATDLNVTQKLQMTSYEIGNAYVTAYITYFGQYTQPSACPAGSFLLPPSYALDIPTGQDVRIDEVWVSPSLTSWTVAVSTGGATNYPTNSAPILYPYETCLVPK